MLGTCWISWMVWPRNVFPVNDMKAYLCIDPGANGGLALRIFGRTVLYPMPATRSEIGALLTEVDGLARADGVTLLAWIEEVKLNIQTSSSD